jgi:hypothetical protein
MSRPDLVDFDRILRSWGDHFGFDRLIVRIYDEVVSNGNLMTDFCKIIGFTPPENDPYFQLQRNISPDEQTIQALRLVNRCKANFPFFMKDITFKNLKDAFYHLKKGYSWQKRLFRFLARKRYFTSHSKQLIKSMTKDANQEILKKIVGEESMKYLDR